MKIDQRDDKGRFVKGLTPWITGRHHSEETKRKLSEDKKGSKHPMFGKKASLESRQKMSIKMKGNTNGRGNKGRIISEKERQRIILMNTGRPGYWTGKKRDSLTNHKISLTKKKQAEDPKERERFKIMRSKQVFPSKDSKPERMMQIALQLQNIKFEKHKLIKNDSGFYHRVDIFIEPNICIEVDGDYWHRLPRGIKRDIEINHELNKLGYQIIRIWEHDIYKNTDNCIEKIITMLKSHEVFQK